MTVISRKVSFFIFRYISNPYTAASLSRYAYGLERATVGTEHYVELSGLEHLAAFGIVIREFFLGDVESYFLALACLEHDAVESFQLLNRTAMEAAGSRM